VEISSRRSETTASGRPIAPSAGRPQGLATISLVLAASTIFLCPAATPLSILLGPFAWLFGWLDARDARRRGQRQTLPGRMGAAIGRVVTVIVGGILALILMVAVVDWMI